MILAPGRNCWRQADARRAGLLVDARSYYRALYHSFLGARRYILVAAWQIDTRVALLRGEEAHQAPAPVELLALLEWLCRQRPRLRVWILAWNYNLIFAHDREWWLRRKFQRAGQGRIRFELDGNHPPAASHHEKLVVVDGRVGFLGSTDVAEGRWDGREHHVVDPLRVSGGDPDEPRHEVQCYLEGDAVALLVEHFRGRWQAAGHGGLELPFDSAPWNHQWGAGLEAPRQGCGRRGSVAPSAPDRNADWSQSPPFPEALPLPSGPVALSRTRGPSTAGDEGPIEETLRLLVDALTAAEELIYWETQYFSSLALARALAGRFRDPDRPRLEVILMVPRTPESPAEQLAVSERQAHLLGALRAEAREHGHALGIFYALPAGEPVRERERHPTYLHSKLLVVDDRFLTVGSADATDRSLGVDSELNATWEAARVEDPLGPAIRAVRLALLAEHTGLPAAELESLADGEGSVGRLETLATSGRSRLCPHPLASPRDSTLGEALLPAGFGFDPDGELARHLSREPWVRPRSALSAVLHLFDRLRGRRAALSPETKPQR